MNRINPISPCRAPRIRAAALVVFLFAVMGPQAGTARPVALAYADAAAWVGASAVGWAGWNESHHRNAHTSSWCDSLRSVHPTPLDAEGNLLRTAGGGAGGYLIGEAIYRTWWESENK